MSSGRVAKPLQMRALPGENSRKQRASSDFKPGKLTVENAEKWRDELLSMPLEKRLWDLYISEMQPFNLLAGIDSAMLAALCIEQAIYFTAAKEVGQAAFEGKWNKLTYEKGGAYRGAMAVGNKSFEHMMSLSAQFGAMPAARVKLAAVSAQMNLFDDEEDDEQTEKTNPAVARMDEFIKKKLGEGKAVGLAS